MVGLIPTNLREFADNLNELPKFYLAFLKLDIFCRAFAFLLDTALVLQE